MPETTSSKVADVTSAFFSSSRRLSSANMYCPIPLAGLLRLGKKSADTKAHRRRLRDGTMYWKKSRLSPPTSTNSFSGGGMTTGTPPAVALQSAACSDDAEAKSVDSRRISKVFFIRNPLAGASRTHLREFSYSPVIRTPGLDRFLDVGARELLVQGALGQLGHFGVGGETQATELIHRQLGNARAQRLGRQLGQAQALFQADHAILHRERVRAFLEHQGQQGDGQQDQQERVEVFSKVAVREVREEVNQSHDQRDHENRQHEEVKRRIPAGVVIVGLRFLRHEGLLAGRRASVAERTRQSGSAERTRTEPGVRKTKNQRGQNEIDQNRSRAEQASQVQRLVTRAQIAQTLWGPDAFVDVEQGINTAIRKIRIALEDDSAQPRFLQTVVGCGYRWVAPLCEEGGET